MSQIDMTRLVGMARTLESMGDAPVVQAENTGRIGNADVSAASSEQAKADAELARSVISLVRDTAGMGKAQADLAERAFGELLASGQPLSGREVAAVITAAVHSLQMELDGDAALKTMEEFAAAMQSTPLHTLEDSSLSPDVSRVNARQVENFVRVHVETSAQAETAVCPTPEIDAARQDLEQMRARLGGTPHFPDGKPSYDLSSKKFFGIPLESCRAWCQARIDNSKHFKGFWKAVGRGFGLSDTPQTDFERAALYMESMRALAANRDRIADAFRRSTREGSQLMGSLTRLACHPDSNGGAEGMIANIDRGLELFQAQYAEAKARGQLEDFFLALKGVCFEDRMSKLQEYAMRQLDRPQSGELHVDVAHAADHDRNDTMLDALEKEIGALLMSNPDAEIDWEHGLLPHLAKTMVGEERQAVNDDGTPKFNDDGTPVRAAITEQDIIRLRGALNNDLFFED